MTYIMGKTRKDIIKTLLKLGETVIEAKAEIIYAVKRGWFPHLTTEEIMEEIKKDPEAYEHYRAGLIKIVEIKESKLSECCPICDGTGTNTHVERDELGIKKFVEYPCQCQKDGEKEGLVEATAVPNINMQEVRTPSSKPSDFGQNRWLRGGSKRKEPIPPLPKCEEEESIIGTGSVSNQNEFNKVKKWENKKD